MFLFMEDKGISWQMEMKKLIELDAPRAWRTYLGGALLSKLHGRDEAVDDHFPEEWIMSVVSARNVGREMYPEEGMSHLKENESMTLKALLDSNPDIFLGKRHAAVWGSQPGVLVKLIDSAERLTIQVHPDRKKAEELFHAPFGKTECWHILDGRDMQGERPCIYIGFKEGITPKYWKSLFDKQDITGMLECLHRFDVNVGDTILIEGGVPHAIGAGCFLAEIQEPTDYTIRVERTTPSGFAVADEMCHQGLGFDRMFECFHYEGLSREEVKKRWFLPKCPISISVKGSISQLVGRPDTDYFSMREITVQGSMRLKNEAFCALYVLKGKGLIRAGDDLLAIRDPQQIFVPACTEEFTIDANPGQALRILQCFGPYKKE